MSDLRHAFHDQAASCASMGSPFMARLMQDLAALLPLPKGPLATGLDGFSGDPGPRGQSLPLRLAGGLHALVLNGAAPDLAAVYPPFAGGDLGGRVAQALSDHAAFLADWIKSPPQTNETGRSAVLIAGACEVAAQTGLPLVLSELGASAGLNLGFDRYALKIGQQTWGDAQSPLCLRPDWRGARPVGAAFRVVQRQGVDLDPLDPSRDHLRLLAYVWPDQADRLHRMRVALSLAKAGDQIAKGDAADWIEMRLTQPQQGACHMVFHTVAHQYFPKSSQARIRRAMERAGARATRDAPLAWLGMEADGGAEGAGVTLRLWPGDVRLDLGRAGFHGQWVEWRVRPRS